MLSQFSPFGIPVQGPPTRTRLDTFGMSLRVVVVLAVMAAMRWAAEILIVLVMSVLVGDALNPIVAWMQRRKITRTVGAAVLLRKKNATTKIQQERGVYET